MAFVKFCSGKCIETKPNKDLDFELVEMQKKIKVFITSNGDTIETTSLKRIIKTENNQAIEKLKELSVDIGFWLQPKDRLFQEHYVLVEDNDIEEAFKKMKFIKKEIEYQNNKRKKIDVNQSI